MKKTANIFFKVGKILDIVAMVGWIFAIIAFFMGSIAMAAASTGSNLTAEEAASVAAGSVAYMVAGIVFLVYLPFFIVALVLNVKANNCLKTAKTKHEAIGWAITSIVAGAMSCAFTSVAGILMLCMSDEDYQRD